MPTPTDSLQAYGRARNQLDDHEPARVDMLATIDIVKLLEPNWTHLRGVSPHILPAQEPDCELWTFQKQRIVLEAHQNTGVSNDILFFRLWATDVGLLKGMDEKVMPLRLALLSVAAHWLDQVRIPRLMR